VSKKSKPWRSAVSAIRSLWASLPRLECQGKCWLSCGPIAMTALEEEIIEQRLGGPLPPLPGEGQGIACPLLAHHRCSVYTDRPTICRAWGMIQDDLMRCPFGCRPSKLLSNQEARAIFRKVEAISDRYQQERNDP